MKMNYRIEEKEAFQAVVVSKRLEPMAVPNPLPDFWKAFFEKGLDKKLPPMCGYENNYDKATNTYAYGIGCPSDMVVEMQDDFETWDVPANKYFVIKMQGNPGIEFDKTWKEIHTNGLPNKDYEMTDGVNFEYYYDAENFELWIAVKDKVGKHFCQSCAVPFEVIPRGKNTDGTDNQDYCKYCYDNGDFTYPNATMEDVIEACIPNTVPDPFQDEETARKAMNEFFPTLKRWAT